MQTDEYSRLLHSLLPPGPAWNENDRLLSGMAPALAAVHQRADQLLSEINPAQTTELIDRYEKLCGLPDSCTPTDDTLTLTQRQGRLDAKINLAGGINAAFYRRQLDALGYYDVTIETFQHLDASPDPEWGSSWPYYWRVNIPGNSTINYMTCSSECNESLRAWGDTIVECIIDKLCPSHTIVVFSYPDE